MIKVITAPEALVPYNEDDTIPTNKDFDIRCFLAGGITGCDNWQQKVIKYVKDLDIQHALRPYNDLMLINPRRENFPIGDPNAAEQQITWEFNALSDDALSIFSMYFCASDSDQPICMYELGRYLTIMKQKYPDAYMDMVVISVEKGYKRAQDVYYQVKLMSNDQVQIIEDATPEKHAQIIYDRYLELAGYLKFKMKESMCIKKVVYEDGLVYEDLRDSEHPYQDLMGDATVRFCSSCTEDPELDKEHEYYSNHRYIPCDFDDDEDDDDWED